MTSNFAAWNLKTHPFSPEIGPDGKPIPRDLFRRPLGPATEVRLLSYYHHVYKWDTTQLIGDFSAVHGLGKFPTPQDLADAGALMVLVTGSDDSGRLSLKNLILYGLQQKFGQKPIIVEDKAVSRNKAEVVKSIAIAFMDEYDGEEANPTYEQLDTIFKAETTQAQADPDAYFARLFTRWQKRVDKESQRPRALIVSGGDDYETWRVIYNSVSTLFHLIVVITQDADNAETCRDLLYRKQRPVALIGARGLDKVKAREYVIARLSVSRSAAPLNPLAPFTQEALDELYEPGANPVTRDGGPRAIEWSVGWLNRTLARAIDDFDSKAGAPASIDATHIRRIREAMNGG